MIEERLSGVKAKLDRQLTLRLDEQTYSLIAALAQRQDLKPGTVARRILRKSLDQMATLTK